MLELEPHGPLPPEIYRRRRALAIGIAVLVVAIVAAIVIVVVKGSSSADTKPAAQEPTGEPNTAQGPLAPTPTPEGKSPVVAPPSPNPEPTPTATAAVEPPPILQPGDDCPDSTLAVKGLTNEPRYAIGDQPKFTMVVTNIGLTACQRDVGAAVLAAYVYSLDNKRLWSNLDCAPSNETLVKTFNPGEQVTTEVTWTGMGSEPGCPLPRQPIGPGTYNLVVQLGNLRSATVPFILSDPAAPVETPAPPPPDALPPPDVPPAPPG
ncbi:hypothetical protein [Mycolicibacterium palauense]|uniref:hypothetical protein n=1 Tax=Mycolicibacterium palauense TaxID=2034511 RepID=UPI001C3F4583|nr:hypothetical protein [Mycolicibacterium palauense]